MRKLFGTDGVRGVANTELTPELAFKLGKFGAHVITNCEAWSKSGIGSNREPMKYTFRVTEE